MMGQIWIYNDIKDMGKGFFVCKYITQESNLFLSACLTGDSENINIVSCSKHIYCTVQSLCDSFIKWFKLQKDGSKLGQNKRHAM